MKRVFRRTLQICIWNSKKIKEGTISNRNNNKEIKLKQKKKEKEGKDNDKMCKK